tara:strand:+ start:375 stop:572 length:198 start_codon:yes stop_codon:yes gene_type:complete
MKYETYYLQVMAEQEVKGARKEHFDDCAENNSEIDIQFSAKLQFKSNKKSISIVQSICKRFATLP